MDKKQYNFYTQNRPIKEAFIVNSKSLDARQQIDKIIEYNQYVWGGGYNQIILRNNVSIADDWFDLLKAYDPDIIKIFEDLPEEIEKKINFNLTPCYIEKIESYGLRTKGLLRFPSKENLYNNKLVLFKYLPKQDEENDNLKTFLQYNFGIFQDFQWQHHSIKDIEKKEIIDISNIEDMAKTLENQANHSYSNYSTKYLSQICTFANRHIQQPENRNFNTLLTVFVGDNIEDIVNFWNQSLLEENWRQHFQHKLFLPLELTKNDDFMSVLSKWLNIRSDYAANQHYSKLKLVSYSLEEQKLEEVAKKISKYVHVSKEKRASLNIPKFMHNFLNRIPSLEEHPDEGTFLEPTQRAELNSTLNNNSTICTQRPSNKYGNTSEYYVTDLYIEVKDTINEEIYYLIKLPARKDIAKDICKTGFTRVNNNNQISILRQHGDPTLLLSMPDENNLFKKILRDNNYNNTENIINNAQISDKGQYLKGFIELFGGIQEAEYFISDEYWDRVFRILSSLPNKLEQCTTNSLKNKLLKRIQEIVNSFLQSDEGLDFLSSILVDTSKSLNLNDKAIPYKKMLSIAQEHWEEYIKTEGYKERIDDNTEIVFSEEDLKADLNELIEKDILLLGISPRCHKCGTRKWYSINDVKQRTKCIGCNNENVINLEETWTYKLNTIVEAAYRHDIIPVILVLNELYRHSSKSFLYAPSTNIYLKGSECEFTDLDIVCIQNGKFIIGEVKKYQKNFSPSDFEKLITVAKIIKPDKVIVSALDMTQEQGPNRTVKEGLDKLYNELVPLGIKAKPYIFYDFPISKENNFIDYINKTE